MSFVVQDGGASTRPPKIRTRRRSRVGSAIAFVFTVFAFIVVACSGDSGNGVVSEEGEPAEQTQPICTQDECPDPGPEPCGREGEGCCRFNNFCQTGLVCHQGTCSTCGVPGGPCCAGNVCQSGSACQSGTCVRVCGAQGLACCSGTNCDPGLACSGGSCQLCGRGGQVCCPGSACNSGFQCTGGICRACGGNGQACCTSGAACGANMACQSGTCRPICGYAFGPCCPGFDSQKCQLAGSGYACNTQFNTCEPCGQSGQLCCASGGSPCSFGNVCGPNPFGSGNTCQRCGGNGDPCCSNNRCNNTSLVCSGGQCASCGSRGLPCCSGGVCSSGVCQSGRCQ